VKAEPREAVTHHLHGVNCQRVFQLEKNQSHLIHKYSSAETAEGSNKVYL
jgi:hypothetical protein